MKKILLTISILAWGFCTAQSLRKATILDHKDRIRITRMNVLNSSARETNLSITPDGKYIYFMSLRGGQRWSTMYMTFRGDSVYDGDIWYAQRVGDRWQRPRVLPAGINTSNGEDEPNISATGNRVYFQSWNNRWQFTGGPYYQASREGARWSKPKGLSGGITEFFRSLPATDGMSISPNERRFIVAAGLDYDANMDLYMSRKTKYGWSYCRKLPFSTRGDDRSVFIAADGKTIYFASDGYDGFGGLDIYKTTMINDTTFGEVINVGAPFNTPADDYGLILTGDGNEAYFIRNGDIYFADLKEADVEMKPSIPEVHISLKGTVRDRDSWTGLKAEIILLDARTKRIIKRFETTNAGKYSVELPNKSRIYDEIVKVEGYDLTRKRLTIEKKYSDEVITANFLLDKPETPPVAVAPDPVETDEEGTEPPVEQQENPITGLSQNPRLNEPDKVEPKVEQPPVYQVEKPENPYSFDGVAENNLILLLDVSASMKKPEKLPLLKESFVELLSHMRPEDQISVIAYSGDARVLIEGVSAANQPAILAAIDNLRSSGGTKGKLALRKAYRIANDHYIPGGNNRIILATDGYFDVPSLYGVADKHDGRKDICLSVFCFGKLPDRKIKELEELADLGRGNFANINSGNVDLALLTEAKAVRK